MTDQRRTVQDLLEKKLMAYEDFLSATRLLKSALESADTPVAEGAVSRRKDLMDLIDGLDHKLANHLPHPLQEAEKNEQAAPWEEALTKVTADLNSTLKKIQEIDLECSALAEQGYETLAGEIDRSTQEQKGLRGYGPSQISGVPKFVSFQT